MSENAILLARGDLTQLGCDALVLPTDRQGLESRFKGRLTQAFRALPGFREDYKTVHRAFLASRNQDWLEIGDAFWVPLRRTEPPYGVACVAAAAGYGHAQHAALATSAALRCAAPHLPPYRTSKKPVSTIALPAILLGGGGGRWEENAVAQAQVEAAKATLAHFPDTNATFVLYTPNDYHLFLEARRQVGAVPSLPASLSDAIPALAGQIAADESVLFVGAGLSEGAGIPGYRAVIAAMAQELGITPLPDDQESYLDIAQWYRNQHGAEHSERVHALLKNLLTRPEVLPSLTHAQLLGMPLRHVLTTNYDDLLEQGLRAQRRYPITVAKASEIPQTGGRGVYTIKLHGDLQRGDGTGDYDDVVLSREDYDDFFDRRPLMASLLEGLLLNRTFLFVGYSLRDPNFRLIFRKLDRLLKEAKRPAYVLTFEEPNAYQRAYWASKNVQLLSLGTDSPQQTLWLFLDRLSAEVEGERHLLLSPDRAEPSPAARGLLGALDRVGAQLTELEIEALSPDEVRVAAAALATLAEEGWRPRSTSILLLWLRLAERASAPDRERFLQQALRYVEKQEQAQLILERIKIH